MDGEGLLNEELPNCWECPKCYQEDNSEKAQVKEPYQICTVTEKRRQMWGIDTLLPLQKPCSHGFSDRGDYFCLVWYVFSLVNF